MVTGLNDCNVLAQTANLGAGVRILRARQRFQYFALSLLTWRFEQNKRLVSAGKIACVGGGAFSIARENLGGGSPRRAMFIDLN
jgi:hypothetical protein